MSKDELIHIFRTVLLCAGLLFALGVGSFFYFRSIYTTDIRVEPEPLVINTTEKATSGVLTIWDENGNETFQYVGEIDILNNGTNGEEIKIEVHLP